MPQKAIYKHKKTGDIFAIETDNRGYVVSTSGRAFEKYLRTGKAPSSNFTRIFEQFKQWLTNIYKTITGKSPLNIKVSPELKKVFDRLLSKDTIKVTDEKSTTKTRSGQADSGSVRRTGTERRQASGKIADEDIKRSEETISSKQSSTKETVVQSKSLIPKVKNRIAGKYGVENQEVAVLGVYHSSVDSKVSKYVFVNPIDNNILFDDFDQWDPNFKQLWLNSKLKWVERLRMSPRGLWNNVLKRSGPNGADILRHYPSGCPTNSMSLFSSKPDTSEYAKLIIDKEFWR